MAEIKRFFEAMTKMDVGDLASFIMIPTLLVYGPEGWYSTIPMLFLSIVALLSNAFRRSFWFWYLAALIMGIAIYFNWYEADNHKYVLAYICLALGLAFFAPSVDTVKVLRVNAKALLILAMGLAVIWKLRAPDYLNYDFFLFTLVADERFAAFSHWLSGISFAELQENRAGLDFLQEQHLYGVTNESPLPLLGLDKVQFLARFMTWWTLFIEAAIALAFLLSFKNCKIISKLAHAALCLFLISTYAVATVPAFCICLLVLGICATSEEDKFFRGFYVACALLVQLYSIPFAGMLGLI